MPLGSTCLSESTLAEALCCARNRSVAHSREPSDVTCEPSCLCPRSYGSHSRDTDAVNCAPHPGPDRATLGGAILGGWAIRGVLSDFATSQQTYKGILRVVFPSSGISGSWHERRA